MSHITHTHRRIRPPTHTHTRYIQIYTCMHLDIVCVCVWMCTLVYSMFNILCVLSYHMTQKVVCRSVAQLPTSFDRAGYSCSNFWVCVYVYTHIYVYKRMYCTHIYVAAAYCLIPWGGGASSSQRGEGLYGDNRAHFPESVLLLGIRFGLRPDSRKDPFFSN